MTPFGIALNVACVCVLNIMYVCMLADAVEISILTNNNNNRKGNTVVHE